MPDDFTSSREDGDAPLNPFERPIRRSDFLGNAGKLAAGALSLGGLGSLLSASSSIAATPTRSGSRLRAAVLPHGRVPRFGVLTGNTPDPFINEIWINPLDDFLKQSNPSWSATFFQNPSTSQAIATANEYVASNYAVLIVGGAGEMTPYESTVQAAIKAGTLVFNHAVDALGGVTQNVIFSHKAAGIGVGGAAVAWARKHHVTAPVVGLLADSSDPLGSQRTTYAWKTIKAAFSNASLAATTLALDTPTGTTATADMLSAHPTINLIVSFNTIAGVGALTACKQAGKTDPTKFFLGCTDVEQQTLDEIASGTSIMQANWGSFFAADMVLMARDAIANILHGTHIPPTRLILGEAITTPAEAKAFNSVAYDPLNPKYAYVMTKYFTTSNTALKTDQIPSFA
jgi:ABC-type sugar transport system substrate-binding protein